MPDASGAPPPTGPVPADPAPASTLVLVERARAGDREAVETLAARYLPRLNRWARGRLPAWARDLSDTQDIVQETVFRTFQRIESFDVRGEGALQAYLRQALMNRIREEIRRVGRRPATDALESRAEDDGPTPLEVAVGREAAERYEAALARLRPGEREAIIAKVEMGLTNEELADALGKPSANAARVAVERALIRLATEMHHERRRSGSR
jgi:RNA polymerase sigma-70 factor, ECF subfamily